MSSPIPPATVAIPPTTWPDPPPLDWDGPHRRLDRAAQEMMGGEKPRPRAAQAADARRGAPVVGGPQPPRGGRRSGRGTSAPARGRSSVETACFRVHRFVPEISPELYG